MPSRKRSRPTLKERGLKGRRPIVLHMRSEAEIIDAAWREHQEGENAWRAQQISDRRQMMRAHVISEAVEIEDLTRDAYDATCATRNA